MVAPLRLSSGKTSPPALKLLTEEGIVYRQPSSSPAESRVTRFGSRTFEGIQALHQLANFEADPRALLESHTAPTLGNFAESYLECPEALEDFIRGKTPSGCVVSRGPEVLTQQVIENIIEGMQAAILDVSSREKASRSKRFWQAFLSRASKPEIIAAASSDAHPLTKLMLRWGPLQSLDASSRFRVLVGLSDKLDEETRSLAQPIHNQLVEDLKNSPVEVTKMAREWDRYDPKTWKALVAFGIPCSSLDDAFKMAIRHGSSSLITDMSRAWVEPWENFQKNAGALWLQEQIGEKMYPFAAHLLGLGIQLQQLPEDEVKRKGLLRGAFLSGDLDCFYQIELLYAAAPEVWKELFGDFPEEACEQTSKITDDQRALLELVKAQFDTQEAQQIEDFAKAWLWLQTEERAIF